MSCCRVVLVLVVLVVLVVFVVLAVLAVLALVLVLVVNAYMPNVFGTLGIEPTAFPMLCGYDTGTSHMAENQPCTGYYHPSRIIVLVCTALGLPPITKDMLMGNM